MTCSGGSAAAPASLPRREQRKAGGGGPPSSPVRYNGITSVKEQRANRPVRVSRARKVSAQAGASDKNRTQTDNGSQFLPRRCPFSASSPTLSSAATAVPNGQSRAQEARAAPSFLSLAPGRVRWRGGEGRILGAKFGPSVPWSGGSAPRNGPAVPWNGQPLRGAGGLFQGIDGGFRGGEDALRGTGGPLRRGEPCSSERLARCAEREPRESGSLTTEVPNEAHPGGPMGSAPVFFFIGSGSQGPAGEDYPNSIGVQSGWGGRCG